MALLSPAEEYDRAAPHAPFSNGTEGEAWMQRWCYRCVHDRDEDCPLLTVAMIDRTPAAWTPTDPHGLADRYTCAEFTPTEPPAPAQRRPVAS